MFNSTLRAPDVGATLPAVALRDVRRVYGRGEGTVVALDGVTVGLPAGSFTAVMGPSGSGKSTFLNVAAGLDRPTAGTVALGDIDLTRLSEQRLAILRRERIGFIFQAFNLLPSLTVAQNIALPLRLNGRRARRASVREVAARVGLESRLHHRPSELSGGQQQRVAIARALVGNCPLILADEPTGALDSKTADEIMDLIRELNQREKLTFVLVTHDHGVGARCDRIVRMRDGLIVDEAVSRQPSAIRQAEEIAALAYAGAR